MHPPSLKLPALVSALSADRTGDAVALHWDTPSKTTDGVHLAGKHGAGQLTAEICRSETAADAACPSPGHVAVTAGDPAEFHDALPPSLVSGSLRPLYYRVRVLNGAGKGAKYVSVQTLAGPAPPAVRGLGAAPVLDGVALRWQVDPAADRDRTVLQVERVSPAAGARPVTPTAPKPAGGMAPPHTELLAVEPAAHDPGGAIDTGARPGMEQRYTVLRTRSLQIAGKTLTATSLPAAITVAATAKAPPPPPPTGLESLVNTLGAPEIDLVWQPVDGAAGYLVFRAEGTGAPARLTAQPITGLSYADAAVRAGVRYRYSVVSVNAGGDIGQPGADLVQSIPQP